jgi:hypothetical protein
MRANEEDSRFYQHGGTNESNDFLEQMRRIIDFISTIRHMRAISFWKKGGG